MSDVGNYFDDWLDGDEDQRDGKPHHHRASAKDESRLLTHADTAVPAVRPIKESDISTHGHSWNERPRADLHECCSGRAQSQPSKAGAPAYDPRALTHGIQGTETGYSGHSQPPNPSVIRMHLARSER
jgi:hypothetical protein